MAAQPDWSIDDDEAKDAHKPNGTDKPTGLIIHNAGLLIPAKIPPRQWLLGTSFCRKFLSGLVGTGGDGKTAIRYKQYVAAATGRSLTNETVHQRCRVLIVCLEDHIEEVERRIAAIMVHHGIEAEKLDGWLFYCCPRGLKLLLTTSGNRIPGPLLDDLRTAIQQHNIDIVGLDPFVKSHGVEENDNNAIDEVCILLAQLGDEFNIAPDLIHHTRKGGAQPGDAERSRGASAAVDAMRLVRTITRMTDDEATTFGISPQERVSLVRVDDAKVNLLPRSSDAIWFRLVSVEIGNGDNVQTVECWMPPKVFDGLTVSTACAIIDEIDAGLPNGQRYSAAAKADKRAAWKVVHRHIPDKPPAHCRMVVNGWRLAGVLTEETYHNDERRADERGLFANPAKRPGPVHD
jgi:AAA domain